MQGKTKDWDISDLYSKSWKIIQKNKILWIFAIAAAAGGSSFASNASRLFNSSGGGGNNLSKTSNTASAFSHTIGTLLGSVPVGVYVFLGIGILILILISIVINIVYRAWANGALIAGINEAQNGGKVTIGESSNKAFSSIKGIIWLSIVPGLLYWIIFLALAIILGILIAGLSGLAKTIAIVVAILASIIFLIGLLLLVMTQIWAIRRVTLDKRPAKIAFEESFSMVKAKFWRMLGLGLLNGLLGIVVGILGILLLVVGIALGVISVLLLHNFVAATGIIIVILVLVYVFISSIINGFFSAFKASVWTLAYEIIKGGFDGKK